MKNSNSQLASDLKKLHSTNKRPAKVRKRTKKNNSFHIEKKDAIYAILAQIVGIAYLVLFVLAYLSLDAFVLGEKSRRACIMLYFLHGFLTYLGCSGYSLKQYREYRHDLYRIGVTAIVSYIVLSIGCIALMFLSSGGFKDGYNEMLYYPICASINTIAVIVLEYFLSYKERYWYPIIVLVVPLAFVPAALLVLGIIFLFYVLKFLGTLCEAIGPESFEHGDETYEYTDKNGEKKIVTTYNRKDFYDENGRHVGTSDDAAITIHEDDDAY